MDQATYLRQYFQDISGSRQIAVTDTGTLNLKAARAGHTHYIQRVIVYITTDFAASIIFRDSSGTVKVCEVPSSPGDETRWDFDFGALGVPITQAEAFVAVISGAGLTGHMEWVGYCRQTGTMTASAFAAS